MDCIGSSPHTRGAQEHDHRLCVLVRIIPAYAGSTLESVPAVEPCWDHPRIRGEHRFDPCEDCSPPGSSPHTRGAPRYLHFRRQTCRIIPAYAGSTPTTISTYGAGMDHPRIRGEHVEALLPLDFDAGSSPHTRGARVVVEQAVEVSGIIPAYAGSTCGASRRRSA